MLLSGSPRRLPPGGAGYLCAGVYILLHFPLCVRGSALHPAQGTEVHCRRSPSVPCMWVLRGTGVYVSACVFWRFVSSQLTTVCFITRPVHHDRSLHLHRPLPCRWDYWELWPQLHPGMDRLRSHLLLCRHLHCTTQEIRTLEPAGPDEFVFVCFRV